MKQKPATKEHPAVTHESVKEIPWDDEPLTPEEERAIEEGRRAFREGRYVEWDEFKHELARRHQRARAKRR